MEENKLYKGHEIYLTQSWTFRVSGPEFDKTDIFETFKAAQEEIDKRVNEAARIEAKNVRVSLRVLNRKGVPVEITGINRRNGEVIGVDGERFYPNVPWVAEAFARVTRIREEMFAIDKKLDGLTMRANRSYGRIESERYTKYISDLEEEVKAMEAKAIALAAPAIVTAAQEA